MTSLWSGRRLGCGDQVSESSGPTNADQRRRLPNDRMPVTQVGVGGLTSMQAQPEPHPTGFHDRRPTLWPTSSTEEEFARLQSAALGEQHQAVHIVTQAARYAERTSSSPLRWIPSHP